MKIKEIPRRILNSMSKLIINLRKKKKLKKLISIRLIIKREGNLLKKNLQKKKKEHISKRKKKFHNKYNLIPKMKKRIKILLKDLLQIGSRILTLIS